MRSAARVALKDISDDIIDLKNKISEIEPFSFLSDKHDNYFVTPNYLIDKEITRLNKELGVHNVNYFGNKNGFRK